MGEYNSIPDAMKHKENIEIVFETTILPELYKRCVQHDDSKLEEPEVSHYNKYIPELKKYKYGTPEYNKVREDMMKDGGDHHWKHNRHHPEYFENLVNDMNIVDFVEMVVDWFAASIRSDTDFMDGLDSNIKKYDLPPMIVNILRNTYKDYFKDIEDVRKRHDIDKKKDLKISVYEANKNGLYDQQVIHRIIDQLNYPQE